MKNTSSNDNIFKNAKPKLKESPEGSKKGENRDDDDDDDDDDDEDDDDNDMMMMILFVLNLP